MQELDTNKNIYYNEEGSGFDVSRFVKNLLNKIWAILLVGAIFAAGGLAIAKATYVEVYSAQMTLSFMQTKMVIVKDYSGRKDAPVEYEEETAFYGANGVQIYQFLLKSDEMVGRIQSKLKEKNPDSDYSKGAIESSLNIATVEEGINGFFKISVTSTDKAYCERALRVVLEEFPEYVSEFDDSISIKVIKNPSAPVVTNSDQATTNALYGFMIGAAIVALIIFVITLSTSTVTSLEYLRREVNVKVLGSVPLLEKQVGLFGRKSKTPQGSLLITDSSKVSFAFVESFKSIRTKLENVKSEKGYKAFVVTSTYEDEGKTTVAVNIACALAQKGKSVLLIDSDLRKPAVLHAVGVKSDTTYGLIPIIKGTSTYVDSI